MLQPRTSGFLEFLEFFKSLGIEDSGAFIQRVDKLFYEVSRVDNCFRTTFQTTMSNLPVHWKNVFFIEYSKGLSISEILEKHNNTQLDERIALQLFANRIKSDGFKCFQDFNLHNLLRFDEISAWMLLRVSEFIHQQKDATVPLICSIQGFGMLPSQLCLVLSCISAFFNSWKTMTEQEKQKFDSLFLELIPKPTFCYDFSKLVDKVIEIETELGDEDENSKILSDLSAYLNALDLEKQDTTDKLVEANKRIEEQGLASGDDIIVEKVIITSNKVAEKTKAAADSLTSYIGELRNTSWEVASGEMLYEKITNIEIDMDVYVRVIYNGNTSIHLGTIKDIRTEKYVVSLKDKSGFKTSEIQADAHQLAFAKAWTDYVFPKGTRIMAVFTPRTRDEEADFKISVTWLPGIVGGFDRKKAQYLIFFDIDIDAYIEMKKVRLHFDQVCVNRPGWPTRVEPRENYKKISLGYSPRAEFLKKYLCDKNPPAVHDGKIGESLRAKEGRRTYKATIIKIDRMLYLLRFPKNEKLSVIDQGIGCIVDNCTKHNHSDKWVYRGSTTRLDFQEVGKTERRRHHPIEAAEQDDEERLSRQIAKKSSAGGGVTFNPRSSSLLRAEFDRENSKTVKERKQKATKVEKKILKAPNWSTKLEYIPHDRCTPSCWLSVKSTVEAYSKTMNWPKVVSPFFRPLMNGWSRVIVKCTTMKSKKSMSVKHDRKDYINYIAPCGVRFYDIADIADYLRETDSPLPIMWFSMYSAVDPEVIIEVPRRDLLDPDFSLGMEGVPIPVVNSVDNKSKPKMIYNSTRFARNESVNQILENSSHARSCCSCTDDCSDVTKCECQKLTFLEHSRLNTQLQGTVTSYKFGFLDGRIQSGIYECNSKCLCNKDKCFNYIGQRKIEIPLELFQTAQSGWGVRTLVDIPHGSFISTYAGEILTDQMAEDFSEKEGPGRDMYYADLDFMNNMENEKINRGIDLPDDGIEEDLPQNDSANLKKYFGNDSLFLVDAYHEGNIGRFFNNSCSPNMFVQNVFTDTHDLRFPVMAFFALNDIAAGAELTWDYNYINEERVKCYCGASNCRGYLM